MMVSFMRKYTRFILVLLVLLSAGYMFLVRTVMPKYLEQMRPVAEELASEYINGSVSFGKLVWNGGLTAQVDGITVKDEQGRTVAEVPSLRIYLRPWQAFDKGAKAVDKLELLEPQVYLRMDEQQKWNMASLLKPSDSEETPFYGTLAIKKGQLHVAMPQGEWSFPVEGSVSGQANPKFALSLYVYSMGDELYISGTTTTKGEGRISVEGDALALAPYAPLAKHYASVEDLQGGLEKLALLYVNENNTKRFSGEVMLHNLQGKRVLNGAEHSLRLDGRVRALDNVVSVSGLELALDGQELRLDADVDLRDTENLKGEGLLTAPKLSYDKYELTKLRLPFRVAEQQVIIEELSAGYGGGEISGSATYSIDEQSLVGDVRLKNVTHAVDDSGQNDVHIDAKLAVVAKQEEDGLALQATADTMDLRWRTLTINRMSLDGSWNEQGLKLEHFSATAGEKGVLLASGSVAPEGELKLKGRMTDFPINPFLTAAGQEGRGLCSTGFELGGRLDAPEFAGMIQLTRTEFMQQKIAEAHGFISLKNNLLKVKNFEAHMDQGMHIFSGTIDLRGAEPVVDISLESDNVRIEPIMRLLTGEQEVSVTGNLCNVMQVRGVLSNPSVYGEVHASDGSAMQQLYNNVDGRYSYEQGRLKLSDFLIKAFYAEIKLDGTMEADGRLDFDMDARDVELSQLPIKDETISLGGKINMKGRLDGTLTGPFFRGNVNSEKITINGEALTELDGTVDGRGVEHNTLQLSFKQPYKHDPSGYGMYAADLNLNLREQFIQGKVQMIYGDIGGLLRMARMDYDINGQMQGSLDFCPQGKGSGVLISVTADDVKIHDLNYAHMIFKGSLRKTLLSLDEVKLQEQDDVSDRGLITLDGTVDLKSKLLNINMSSVKANPAIATAVMKDPPEIKGEMDLQAQLRGTLDDPEGSAELTITDGSVSGVGLDRLYASLSLKNDVIYLQELVGTRDAYGVKGAGDIPLDVFRSKEQRRNPRSEMNINLDLNEARLGILPAMTKRVEWGVGDTNGQVRIAGTLEEPLLYGSLKIEDGAVKVKDLDTVLEKIKLDVDFQGNTVLLRNLSTKLGKGGVTAEGSYALHTTEDAAYKLHVRAENAELASQIFSGRIDSEIEIVPQAYFDPRKLKEAKSNRPPQREYRPLIKGNVKLEDVLINMPTIPELGEGESNLGLELQLDLGKKIHLYNSYLYDIWLSGGMNIKGSTVFPVIDGMIKADKGTITYLRTDFKLKEARLNWIEPGTFLPNVTLNSTARFARYNIFMGITGSVEEMDLQLTSDPPMERNTIVRMLTLQRDTAGSNEVTGEDMSNLLSVGLQMTVLGDVETWIKQTLGIDQFRVYTGKVRSGIGFESTKSSSQELTSDERNQYNVLVSKYLNNNFMFGYTTSFNALDRSIFGQYDISRHMNITYSKSYDLNSKSENWYGLEYKISF
jgi:translocation and assembly module TamB